MSRAASQTMQNAGFWAVAKSGSIRGFAVTTIGLFCGSSDDTTLRDMQGPNPVRSSSTLLVLDNTARALICKA